VFLLGFRGCSILHQIRRDSFVLLRNPRADRKPTALEGEPDFAPSSETPDVAPSSKLRKAMSGKPGGYVGQAALPDSSSIG
jgi:hypothetical protein